MRFFIVKNVDLEPEDQAELKDLEEENNKKVKFAVFAAVLVLGLFAVFKKMGYEIDSVLGPLGDYFGGLLNPIFSFLALLALLSTLLYQAKELKLSKVELRKSTRALEAQEEALKKQTFEMTYFSLMDGLSKDTENLLVLEFKEKSEKAIARFFRNLRSHYESGTGKALFKKYENPWRVFRELFLTRVQGARLYVNKIELICKYLQRYAGTEFDKRFYGELLNSKLSNMEKVLIMYYFFENLEVRSILESLCIVDDVEKSDELNGVPEFIGFTNVVEIDYYKKNNVK